MAIGKAFTGSNQLGFPVTLPSGEVAYALGTVPVDNQGNVSGAGASASTGADVAASNDGSGVIAAQGGTKALAFNAEAFLEIANPSNADLWASWGAPALNGAGSFPINPGASFTPPQRVIGTLTLLATTANQPYTINRYT